MATEIRFQATPSSGEVSALLESPANARCLYVLAHGAGAGMRHPFLEAMAARLAEREVATLRYQFPYMGEGRQEAWASGGGGENRAKRRGEGD